MSCVKRCVASSAGSPKRLSEECDPDTVRGAGRVLWLTKAPGFPGVMVLIVVGAVGHRRQRGVLCVFVVRGR